MTGHHFYDPDLLCEMGGVDTRPDAYWDWIEQELEQACADDLRAWCDTDGIPRPPVRPVEDDDDDDGCEQPAGACGPRLNNDGPATAILFVLAPLPLLGLRRRR